MTQQTLTKFTKLLESLDADDEARFLRRWRRNLHAYPAGEVAARRDSQPLTVVLMNVARRVTAD